MGASTRRVALGALAAASLAALPAKGAGLKLPTGVSPELAALIVEHDRTNALLNAYLDDENCEYVLHAQFVGTAGAMRVKVLAFPSRNLSDILAKAACVLRLWPVEDLQAEVGSKAKSEHVYIDDMSNALLLELHHLMEGTLCA
ncbi:hypothetical protein [Methylobacterium sp. J-067]|uniref:hypothetical protein n=1 Tax=Methylobacterium sp. J-067 TaxID=2836648 RepID=UPI001FBBFF25|nr:hypothetical protein [Methylobacterium sp. J-067]MCJ2025099.1 hypothetical protein [Methylobacterium sp. J-067]